MIKYRKNILIFLFISIFQTAMPFLDPFYEIERLNLKAWEAITGKKIHDEGFDTVFSQEENESQLKGIQKNRSGSQKKNNLAHPVYFEDVAGIDNVLSGIQELVDYMKHPEKYKRLGAKMPRGILFVGPPGVGKTTIAKALATESNRYFINRAGSSFVNVFVGQGAAAVRALFNEARKNKPAIIFIDEIDALATKRSSGEGGGNREFDGTVNALLHEMDGFTHDDHTIVIAATNRVDMLDPALLRPGRFDRIVKIDLPDTEARNKILKLYISKLPIVSNSLKRIIFGGILPTDLEKKTLAGILEAMQGMSGAEIENVVNVSALHAVRAAAESVDETHLFSALKEALQAKRFRK